MKSPLLSASLVPLAPARAPLALGPLGPLGPAPTPAQAPGVRRAQQAQRAQRAQRELARGWRCGLECLVQHRPMVRLQSDIRGVYL